MEFDPDLLVPDPSLSFNEGGLVTHNPELAWYRRQFEALAESGGDGAVFVQKAVSRCARGLETALSGDAIRRNQGLARKIHEPEALRELRGQEIEA